MPTFQLTLAHDVSVYGTVEVEAENYAAAVEAARADLADLSVRNSDLWNDISDADWSSSFGYRVVDVYTIDDNGMAQDPLVRNILLTDKDDDFPYSAEQVLVSVTAARITT